jgi:uncharacterized protein YecE (DUF72 family)
LTKSKTTSAGEIHIGTSGWMYRHWREAKWVTGPLVYIRFRGSTPAKYAGCHDSSHLQGWAERIREYQQLGLDVFAYFNNDNHGYAVKNARELRSLLKLPSPPGAEKPAGQWW